MHNPSDQVESATWRTRILPAVLLLLLLLLIISGYWGYQYSRIVLERAVCQTMILEFREAEALALSGPPCEANDIAENLRNYFPTGTKLPVNSRHGKIVEIVRDIVLESIARHTALCIDK